MQNQLISNFESLSPKDLAKYPGEWVAIIDNSIVINSKSFKEIHKFLKKNYPEKKPLIGKLPEANPMVLSIIFEDSFLITRNIAFNQRRSRNMVDAKHSKISHNLLSSSLVISLGGRIRL